MKNKGNYKFLEPHSTGGTATIRISREQILKHQSLYRPVWIETEEPTEQMIINNFRMIHGAWKEDSESAKEMAERLGMELPDKEEQMANLNRNLRETIK